MKAVSLALVALMLAGWMTVQHPGTPGIQYGSMAQCEHYNLDTPGDCTKVPHQQATETAVSAGATLFVVLAYMGLIALLIAGAR